MEISFKMDADTETAPDTAEEETAEAAKDKFSSTWSQLMRNLKVSTAHAQSVLQLLLEKHSEPHRRYHVAEHVLAVIDNLRNLNSCTPTSQLASFFHDAVYDTSRTDNESQSAQLARRTLRTLDSPSVHQLIDDVSQIILATATHELPRNAPRETAAFLDADLAILASRHYARYVRDIEYEYQHMDEKMFREGRAALLRRLLRRDTLFFTAEGRAMFEESARRNVEVEIRMLCAEVEDTLVEG